MSHLLAALIDFAAGHEPCYGNDLQTLIRRAASGGIGFHVKTFTVAPARNQHLCRCPIGAPVTGATVFAHRIATLPGMDRKQHLDRCAGQFFTGVAEQFYRSGVRKDYLIFPIDRERRDRQHFKRVPQMNSFVQNPALAAAFCLQTCRACACVCVPSRLSIGKLALIGGNPLFRLIRNIAEKRQ